jgi:hypothetical protein
MIPNPAKKLTYIRYLARFPTLIEGLLPCLRSYPAPYPTAPTSQQAEYAVRDAGGRGFHARRKPPLNARAIAIRMQAPMKPAIR